MRFAVAAVMLAAGPGWAASPYLVSTTMDKDAPLGVYAVVHKDCSVGGAPDIRIIREPAHGVVILLDGQISARRAKSCALVTAPARQVVYRPAAGFTGRDEVMFDVIDPATGQADTHPVMISVQAPPTKI